MHILNPGWTSSLTKPRRGNLFLVLRSGPPIVFISNLFQTTAWTLRRNSATIVQRPSLMNFFESRFPRAFDFVLALNFMDSRHARGKYVGGFRPPGPRSATRVLQKSSGGFLVVSV